MPDKIPPGHDEQYETDVTDAGKRADRMRHQGELGRVLWLLNEKASWNLEVSGEILTRVEAIQAKLEEGVQVDLGPTNVLLQQILSFLIGETGQASSLGLSFGEPEPKAE